MSHTQDRRLAVLCAIVEDYVSTREPVGSKAVTERHHLGVSPATVRNDMAILEEAGLLVQPHTSAGRIPTDAGYRAFVDSLDEIKPLSAPERAAFQKTLMEAVDLDDVIARAARLLSHLTNQVAVLQYPSLRQSNLRHIELVALRPRLFMLVLITNTGRVEQRTVKSADEIGEDDLHLISAALNSCLTGVPISRLRARRDLVAEKLEFRLRAATGEFTDTIVEVLEAESEERVVVSGTGNLSRYDVDFSASISPVLDALEEQIVLLKLMAFREKGVSVRIGSENSSTELSETSLVTAGYSNGADGEVARVGVIGPTRMNYPAAMSGVLAISQYLTEILQSHR